MKNSTTTLEIYDKDFWEMFEKVRLRVSPGEFEPVVANPIPWTHIASRDTWHTLWAVTRAVYQACDGLHR